MQPLSFNVDTIHRYKSQGRLMDVGKIRNHVAIWASCSRAKETTRETDRRPQATGFWSRLPQFCAYSDASGGGFRFRSLRYGRGHEISRDVWRFFEALRESLRLRSFTPRRLSIPVTAKRIPPGPADAYNAEQALLDWLCEQFNQFGEIYSASIYGTNVYVVSDPDAEHVLLKNWRNYVKVGRS